MKLNNTLLLYISCILSAPQTEAQSPGCITKMECKMNDIFEKMKTDKDFMQCTKLIDDEEAMYKCVFKRTGLRDDQIDLLTNLMSTTYNCEPSSESQFKQCTSKCASDKSCIETCADKKNEKSLECLANKVNVKDFDAKKSVQCSKKCTQDSFSEIIDCDTKCNEPIYKKFGGSAKDSKSDSKTDSRSNEDKSTTTKTNSEDSKPTSSSNTSSTESSSGISNISTGLFGVISVPTLLYLIL